MRTLESIRLPEKPDAIAPDGTLVRLLLALPGGSLAHFELPGEIDWSMFDGLDFDALAKQPRKMKRRIIKYMDKQIWTNLKSLHGHTPANDRRPSVNVTAEGTAGIIKLIRCIIINPDFSLCHFSG